MLAVGSGLDFCEVPPEAERGRALEVLELPPATLGVTGRVVAASVLVVLALAGAAGSRWALAAACLAIGAMFGLDARCLVRDRARRVVVHARGLLIDHAEGRFWVPWAEISGAEFRVAQSGGILRFGPFMVVLPGASGTALVKAIREERWRTLAARAG